MQKTFTPPERCPWTPDEKCCREACASWPGAPDSFHVCDLVQVEEKPDAPRGSSERRNES